MTVFDPNPSSPPTQPPPPQATTTPGDNLGPADDDDDDDTATRRPPQPSHLYTMYGSCISLLIIIIVILRIQGFFKCNKSPFKNWLVSKMSAPSFVGGGSGDSGAVVAVVPTHSLGPPKSPYGLLALLLVFKLWRHYLAFPAFEKLILFLMAPIVSVVIIFIFIFIIIGHHHHHWSSSSSLVIIIIIGHHLHWSSSSLVIIFIGHHLHWERDSGHLYCSNSYWPP